MASYFSKTSIANRAFDLVGVDDVLNIDTAKGPNAQLLKRNYEPVMLRCLRRSPWPFAISRTTLNPSATGPVNEFTYRFPIPADMIKLLRLWPLGCKYKREGQYILSDESSITVKYINDKAIEDPSTIDPSFAEYVSHELAVSICYKITDSVALKNELKQERDNMFREAAAIFSQEDTDDDTVESPWLTTRFGGSYTEGTIKIQGLE